MEVSLVELMLELAASLQCWQGRCKGLLEQNEKQFVWEEVIAMQWLELLAAYQHSSPSTPIAKLATGIMSYMITS